MFQEEPHAYLPSRTTWAQHVNSQRDATTDWRPKNRVGFRAYPGRVPNPADTSQRWRGPTEVSFKPPPRERGAAQGSVHPPHLHVPRERGEQLWFLFSIYLSEPKRTYTSNSTPSFKPSHLNLVPAPPSPDQRALRSPDQPSSVPFPPFGHRRTLLLLPT